MGTGGAVAIAAGGSHLIHIAATSVPKAGLEPSPAPASPPTEPAGGPAVLFSSDLPKEEHRNQKEEDNQENDGVRFSPVPKNPSAKEIAEGGIYQQKDPSVVSQELTDAKTFAIPVGKG